MHQTHFEINTPHTETVRGFDLQCEKKSHFILVYVQKIVLYIITHPTCHSLRCRAL